MNKKIISFTLWGHNPMYTIGAIKNAALSKEVYPGWLCRFYVDNTVPQKIITELLSMGCEILYREKVVDHIASFWRFEPLFDKEISYFIVRDADARLCQREYQAVLEWMESGKAMHIMRDHTAHTQKIMGGMWGGVPNLIENKEQIERDFYRYLGKLPEDKMEFRGEKYFSYDQTFLGDILWPIILKNHIAHDEFTQTTGNELPFPAKRKDKYHFVGNKYDENDKPVYEL